MASRKTDSPAPRRGRLNDGFKQRIVGALVLAALAVIFLPSLFDREGARYINTTSQIPAAPDIQPIEIAEPQVVEGAGPVPEPEELFQPEPVEQSSTAEAEESQDRPKESAPEENAEKEVAKTEDSSPVLDAEGLPHAWVVQVASYGDAARAEKLRTRLMDEGYKSYTRAVTTSKGRFVRVFVGPKVSKADARAAKLELDQLLKAQTLVLKLSS